MKTIRKYFERYSRFNVIIRLALGVVLTVLLAFLLFNVLFISKYYYSDFSHNLSSDVKNSVSEENGKGTFVFGPYIRLNKGNYYITIYGDVEGKSQSTCDAISYSGNQTYYTGIYGEDEKIEISLDEAISDFEFRIIYDGVGKITFDGILIKKQVTFYDILSFVMLVVCIFVLLYAEPIIIRPFRKYVAAITNSICSFYIVFVLCIITEGIVHKRGIPAWSFTNNGLSFYFSVIIFWLFERAVSILAKRSGISVSIIGGILFIYQIIETNYSAYRGMPFSFQELSLINEAKDVIGGYNIGIKPYTIAFFVVVILLAVLLNENVFGTYRRGAKSIVSIVIIILGCVLTYYSENIVGNSIGGVKVDCYEQYGYLYCTLISIPKQPKKPNSYSRIEIQELVEDYSKSNNGNNIPDIILIQAESIQDVSLVTDIKIEDNPFNYLRDVADRTDATLGTYITPMTGGGTCNVEFETLLGYPYENYEGTPFYSQINRETSSIVSVLNENNYETTAIHLNTKHFFNRETVYECLGFDNTIFLEDVDTNEISFVNGWASDESAYRVLINDYENHDSSKPYFGYVVTTQCHGPYSQYDKWNISIESSEIVGDNKVQFESYLNLQMEGFVKLNELIEYFEKVDRDVVIVVYGDHAPGYQLFGMEQGQSIDEQFLIRNTPLLIWNNMGIDFGDGMYISGYKLASLLFEKCDINVTDYYFNYQIVNEIPNMMMGVVVDDGGQILNIDEADNMLLRMEEIKNMEYYRLFD